MFNKKERDEEVKLNDAWEWFKYFEFQRTLNFYAFFALLGALFAVSFHIIMSQSEAFMWLIPMLAFIGVVISITFIFLDIRNTELEYRGRSELRKFGFDPAFENEDDFQEAVHSLKGEADNWKVKWIKESKQLKPFISRTLWVRMIYLLGFSISIICLIYFSALEYRWLLLLSLFGGIIVLSFLKWRRK